MSRVIIQSIDPTVEAVIVDFQRNRLYGSVETKFEDGRVVLIKRTESIKPSDSRTNREEDEQ